LGELFKHPSKVRKISQRGKGITIPPKAEFMPGDEVTQLYDGFVLIVPRGTVVDEDILRRAIKVIEVNKSAGKESDRMAKVSP